MGDVSKVLKRTLTIDCMSPNKRRFRLMHAEVDNVNVNVNQKTTYLRNLSSVGYCIGGIQAHLRYCVRIVELVLANIYYCSTDEVRTFALVCH